MAKVDWDQSEYEQSRGFEPMPRGRYLCIITSAIKKPTKKKDGEYVEVEFLVTRPAEFKGRKLWARLNVHNPSDTAQRIGREQFNSLAAAVGMLHKIADTKQLQDKALVCLVGIEEGQKGPINAVNGFQAHEGAAPTAAKREERKPEPEKTATKTGGGASFDDMDDDIPF